MKWKKIIVRVPDQIHWTQQREKILHTQTHSYILRFASAIYIKKYNYISCYELNHSIRGASKRREYMRHIQHIIHIFTVLTYTLTQSMCVYCIFVMWIIFLSSLAVFFSFFILFYLFFFISFYINFCVLFHARTSLVRALLLFTQCGHHTSWNSNICTKRIKRYVRQQQQHQQLLISLTVESFFPI